MSAVFLSPRPESFSNLPTLLLQISYTCRMHIITRQPVSISLFCKCPFPLKYSLISNGKVSTQCLKLWAVYFLIYEVFKLFIKFYIIYTNPAFFCITLNKFRINNNIYLMYFCQINHCIRLTFNRKIAKRNYHLLEFFY